MPSHPSDSRTKNWFSTAASNFVSNMLPDYTDNDTDSLPEATTVHSTALEFWSQFTINTHPQDIDINIARGWLQREPIPTQLRSQVWIHALQADTKQAKVTLEKFNDSHCEYDDQIRKDLPRTFPEIPLIALQSSQDSILEILRSLALDDPSLGYCQGMSYIISPLISLGLSQPSVFAIVHRLLSQQNLHSFFRQDMRGLKLALYQHEFLLNLMDHDLFTHLADHGVTSLMYCSQWFLTFFAYHFPFEFVYYIIDLMVIEGPWLTLLRFSLSLLLKNSALIQSLEEPQDITNHFKNLLNVYSGNFAAAVRDSFELDLCQRDLDALENEYASSAESHTMHIISRSLEFFMK